ncbi:hypothetical protein PPERSA_01144 [Pseudocohnilembus persalinus]|uniref:TPX2 C-terminal domain-containing protein n=1 Tax=Pseudocohnilembus persalinus TaxID=266149 RepID=A0A0V0QUW1_PSEPJ|nr:hypothetical protein PPERSA_01144 [Pseudocohnilembus persalinus]|eukprot:KRX06066.1 hypothetical protein PPERSA_01144 [Pseudocohnilembus persalinus]
MQELIVKQDNIEQENINPLNQKQEVDMSILKEDSNNFKIEIKSVKRKPELVTPSKILKTNEGNILLERPQNNIENCVENIVQNQQEQKEEKSVNKDQNKQGLSPFGKSQIKSISKSQSKSIFSTPNSKLKQQDIENQKYVSQKQIIENFFKNRSTISNNNSQKKLQNTKPQSPKLSTMMRQHTMSLNSSSVEKSVEKKVIPFRSNSKDFMLRSDIRALERQKSERKKQEVDSLQNSNQKIFPHEPGAIPQYKLFSVQKPEHKQIQFKEFKLSTDYRGCMKEQRLQEKLFFEQQQEMANRQFRAQDLPDYKQLADLGMSKCILEHKITVPKEVKLSTDSRAEFHKVYDQKQLNETHKQNIFQFKAKPAPDMKTQKTPQKPPVRETTIPQEVYLNSNKRAEQRRLFDAELEEKQKLKEQEQAQPIRKYKQVQIEKSHNITVPIQPHFLTDKRIEEHRNKSAQKSNQKTNSQ